MKNPLINGRNKSLGTENATLHMSNVRHSNERITALGLEMQPELQFLLQKTNRGSRTESSTVPWYGWCRNRLFIMHSAFQCCFALDRDRVSTRCRRHSSCFAFQTQGGNWPWTLLLRVSMDAWQQPKVFLSHMAGRIQWLGKRRALNGVIQDGRERITGRAPWHEEAYKPLQAFNGTRRRLWRRHG